MKLGGEFQPLISVTCKNCGNTVFVNGLVIECLDNIETNGDINIGEMENDKK